MTKIIKCGTVEDTEGIATPGAQSDSGTGGHDMTEWPPPDDGTGGDWSIDNETSMPETE